MKNRKCPNHKSCLDYECGACETCDLGNEIIKLHKRIDRLKKKNETLTIRYNALALTVKNIADSRPCKAGDTVYYVSRYYTGRFEIYECVVDHITVYETNSFLSIISKYNSQNYFGVNIKDQSLFFTREGAEKEIERLKKVI